MAALLVLIVVWSTIGFWPLDTEKLGRRHWDDD